MNAPTPSAAVAINQTIAIELLTPSPTNPRKRFDEAKLNELAESIKYQGVLQPLLVREIRSAPGRPAAVWPFPEPYTLADKLYAERIHAGQAEMPSDIDSKNMAGVKVALAEIKKNQNRERAATRYEIVAGERRYRAAKLAGLTELPCFVRELTDLQVLHAQVIENLQRDDLHPLEEAEGYQRLIELGSKAEDLGTEIGKSRAYVYARLKLLTLCNDARKAFYDGLLDASRALLIARIPTDKLQLEALKAITHPRFGDEAMSYREAKHHIHEHFMLDLAKAPWSPKDAELLPKAGACATCPKLTGNQPDLFDDVQSKNVCTDTVCFGLKKVAHVLLIQKQAAADGHKVIAGKEAKKMIPHPHYSNYSLNHSLQQQGMTLLTEAIPNDPKGTTWEKALIKTKLLTAQDGKPSVQKTLIEDPHHKGEIIQTISIEAATKALRQAGFEIKLKGAASSGSKADKQRLEKEKAAVGAENAFRTRLFEDLRASIAADLAAGKMRPELFRVLAEDTFNGARYDNDLVKGLIAWHAPDLAALPNHDARAEAFEKRLPDMDPSEHFLIVFEMEMASELDVDIWALKRADGKTPQTMLRIA
ncbi:MAG TPA: ParB/RepB/Spo0J family partition protein, partial [Gallionella sp.]